MNSTVSKPDKEFSFESLNLKIMTVLGNALLLTTAMLAVPGATYLIMISEYLWLSGLILVSLLSLLLVFICFVLRGMMKILIRLNSQAQKQNEVASALLRSPYSSASSLLNSPMITDSAEMNTYSGSSGIRSGSQIVENETIYVHCPKCKTRLVCNEILMGHNVRCKKCSHRFELTSENTSKPNPASF